MSTLIDRVMFRAASSGTGSFVVSSAITGYMTPATGGAVNATVYSYAAESDDKSEWEIGTGTYTTGDTTLTRTPTKSSNSNAAVNFTAAPKVALTALADDLPTPTEISNWNTAYGWGNHASAGYLDSGDINSTVQGYSANTASWAGVTRAAGFDTWVATPSWANFLSLVTGEPTFYTSGGTDVSLADGGTGASLTDPNADRIMFWDDSAGAVTWLAASTGLTITTTNIALSSGAQASLALADTAYQPGGTDIAVADGGTGRSSHTAYAVLCGGTTSTGAQQSIASVGTSGQVLTSNGAGALPTFQDVGGVTWLTPIATTSGTAHDFSVGAGAEEITVAMIDVSLSGSDHLLIQLGDSGGIETTGYSGASTNGGVGVNATDGIVIRSNGSANQFHGFIKFVLVEASTNTWVASGVTAMSNGAFTVQSAGSKSLSGSLTTVRMTRTGSNTFDGGSVAVGYA